MIHANSQAPPRNGSAPAPSGPGAPTPARQPTAANGNRQGRREAVAAALAAGQTVKGAAALCGVGERTVHTWLDTDPSFRNRVRELQAGMVASALGRMADAMTEAADTLRSLLHAKNETVRLGAARSILELTPRLGEAVELEERLQALEDRFDQTPEEITP